MMVGSMKLKLTKDNIQGVFGDEIASIKAMEGGGQGAVYEVNFTEEKLEPLVFIIPPQEGVNKYDKTLFAQSISLVNKLNTLKTIEQDKPYPNLPTIIKDGLITIDGNEYPYVIEEKMQGKAVDPDIFDKDLETSKRIIEAFGKSLGLFHKRALEISNLITKDSLYAVQSWDYRLNQIEGIPTYEEIKGKIGEAKKKYDELSKTAQHGVVYSECLPMNMLYASLGSESDPVYSISMVDLLNIGKGPVALDLGHILSDIQANSRKKGGELDQERANELTKSFLEGYAVTNQALLEKDGRNIATWAEISSNYLVLHMTQHLARANLEKLKEGKYEGFLNQFRAAGEHFSQAETHKRIGSDFIDSAIEKAKSTLATTTKIITEATKENITGKSPALSYLL